jgi:hypothetical protein
MITKPFGVACAAALFDARGRHHQAQLLQESEHGGAGALSLDQAIGTDKAA